MATVTRRFLLSFTRQAPARLSRFFRSPDAALLDIAICWELNSREPATWKNGKILPLFPDHSPEANRLEQLKQQMRAYYDRELEKQQKQRQMPPTTGN